MGKKVLNEKQLRRREEFRVKNEKRREQTQEWRRHFGEKRSIEKRAEVRSMGQMLAKRVYQKAKREKENANES
jgi:hypothetical protein